jgi:putative sigma-54 modulation protein
MEAQITARHFEANPALRDYASERLSKLERYYDGIMEARVILSEDGGPAAGKSAEIIVHVYQKTLSANSEGTSHEDAIDQCVKALRRQIKKYKSKLRSTDKDYLK